MSTISDLNISSEKFLEVFKLPRIWFDIVRFFLTSMGWANFWSFWNWSFIVWFWFCILLIFLGDEVKLKKEISWELSTFFLRELLGEEFRLSTCREDFLYNWDDFEFLELRDWEATESRCELLSPPIVLFWAFGEICFLSSDNWFDSSYSEWIGISWFCDWILSSCYDLLSPGKFLIIWLVCAKRLV